MCDADLSAAHPDPMVQRGRDRVQRRNMPDLIPEAMRDVLTSAALEPTGELDLNVRTVHAVIPVTREWCEDRMIPIPDGDT